MSIHHARISYSIHRGYVIEDLGSATGTWIDEECIKGEDRPIALHTILRFGSTSFEVVASNRIQPWMQAAAAIAAGMLVFALLVFVGMALVTPRGQSPRIVPHRNQKIECNTDAVHSLAIPADFLRSRGIAVQHVRIHHVSDFDNNKCDEVWLRIRDRYDVAITFGEGGFDDWVILGEFPSKCHLPTWSVPTDYLPSVGCGGTAWQFPDGGSKYEIFRHDGVVVFYRPVDHGLLGELTPRPAKKKKTKGKARRGALVDSAPKVKFADRIKVGRFTLADPDKLAGFLLDRGISAPVHYVICEGAFPNEVEPQALFSGGAVQDLGQGCINQLRLEGIDGVHGQPIAFALTETGRKALLDDLTTFFGGDPEGLFLKADVRNRLEQYRADPGEHLGSIKLLADSTGDIFGPLFDPIPNIDARASEEPRQLIESGTAQAAPRSRTFNLLSQGKWKVGGSPGSCADIRVEVHEFTSEGWENFFPFQFLDVREYGCHPNHQRLFTARYNGVIGRAVHDANPKDVGGLDVRAVVETHNTGRGIQVLRARIAVRDPNDLPPALNTSPTDATDATDATDDDTPGE